uniref:DNA repair protein SWI5 homolog n=1 Tax=Scylla olivacea TaxID=85551 RepID=A0A0N7ZBJ3_SCYOL
MLLLEQDAELTKFNETSLLSSDLQPLYNMAFRSPFRSPRPSQDNSVDTTKTSTAGQSSASKSENTVGYIPQKDIEGDVVRYKRMETPQKSVLKRCLLSNTTPQRAGNSLHDCRRKSFSRQFNSPFRSPSSKLPQQQLQTPEDQLADLIKQETEIDKEIATLKESGFQVEELQGHIRNLHRYNEVKDAAQLVLGRLAELEQVTVKEMHKKYKVPVTD